MFISQTFPKAAILIDIGITIKCIGVATSYLLVSGQNMSYACAQFQSEMGWSDD